MSSVPPESATKCVTGSLIGLRFEGRLRACDDFARENQRLCWPSMKASETSTTETSRLRLSTQVTICRNTARTGAASRAMSLSGKAISSYIVGVTLLKSRFSRIAAFAEKSML